MARYFAVTKNEQGNPVVTPFLTWIRANQAQFEYPIPTPNTHSPFGKVVQLGWIRRDYNSDVYGIKPDENGDFDFADTLFDDAEFREELNELIEYFQEAPKAISPEQDLQRTLRLNIGSLENGLEIIDGGLERSVLSGGKIDILCRDPQGSLVAVKLETGEAKAESLVIILSHIADLVIETGSPVRGILVAHTFDQRLRNLMVQIPQVQLKKYVMTFIFENA